MDKRGSQILSSAILATTLLWVTYEASNRYYFNVAEEEIAIRRAKLEELKRANDEDEQIKANADQLEASLKDAERSFDSLKPLLPYDAELPKIFDWLAKRALERNLKLDNFSQVAKPQVEKEGDVISEIPLQVEVFGNYDGVSRFLEDFSRYERILRVKGVNMLQEQQQFSPLTTVHARISFSAYIAK